MKKFSKNNYNQNSEKTLKMDKFHFVECKLYSLKILNIFNFQNCELVRVEVKTLFLKKYFRLKMQKIMESVNNYESFNCVKFVLYD